jgi:hypothetical protein
VATFPDHSLTFEDLLDAAERHLRQAQPQEAHAPEALGVPEVNM